MNAIDTAIKQAEKNGTTENGIVVKIPINNKATGKTLSVTLKAKTVDKLIKSNITYVDITTNAMPSYRISLKTLKQLDKQSKGGDIVIKITKKTIPTKQEYASKSVGTRPVYRMTMIAVKGTKKISLSNWNNNTITVMLPYTPSEKEIKGNLHIAKLSAKGNVKWIGKSKYNAKEKAVVFEMDNMGMYGVGYKK